METVTDTPAAPEPSEPATRETREESLRRAAMIFTAGGFTGARIREGKDPGELLFADLADALDALAAEGLTAEACRELLGFPEDGGQ